VEPAAGLKNYEDEYIKPVRCQDEEDETAAAAIVQKQAGHLFPTITAFL